MGPKRSPTGQISPPRGSSGVLLGRLGRQVGLRRALWAEKRSLKIERRALGTILGSSWRVLGPFWVAFPPPWGAPGRLQEVIFRLFWDVPAEILKMSFCLLFFHICRVFFLCYYLPSVVFLAPWLAASCICKKLKIHWFLWVARHMRLVLATPEAINFQWGRVINIGGKKSSKTGLTGPENKVKKGAFLRPKWLPKWTPEASRNVCTRRSATEAANNAS